MQSGKGGEVRTLFAGDGTEEVRTVIVTFPPETVIVTVPVGVTDEATDPGTVDIPETDVTTAGPEVTEKPGEGYEYTMHTYERSLGGGSTASFTYPRISGMANETLQTKINTLLGDITEYDFTSAEFSKDYADSIASGVTVGYRVDECDVTFINSAFMSVRWRVSYTRSNADEAYRTAFVHHINLSTGKEIKTKDIFSDFYTVLDLLEGGKMTRVESTDGFDSRSDFSSLMKNMRARVPYSVFPPVYFTPDTLCVIVCSEHQSGGWAEYSVPLADVRHCLKVSP